MSPLIRALIVDDEPPARENLRFLLEGEPDVEIVGERGSGSRAVEAIETLAPDAARERIRERGVSDLAGRLASLLGDRGDRWMTHLTVRERDRVVVLEVDEVERFAAAGDYVEAHIGRRTHFIDDTMKSLEARLDPLRFVRIHRSHIVRVDRIRELHPFFHGDYVVVLEGGTQLRMSRGRRRALEHALGRAL